MKSDYIWMNGELVPFEKATVHFLNPTMHYGMGIFEGIRCYNTPKGPAVFRLREHLKRFIDSAHIAGITDFNYTLEDLRAAVHDTIRANKFTSCYIRPLIYMLGSFNLSIDAWHSQIGIATWEWGAYLGDDAAAKGIRLGVSSFTRHHPNVMMTKAKIAGNYVNSTLAATMASRGGFDEAILLDPQGYVAECTGENLFLVRGGKIYCPPRTTVLEGVTRDSVLTLAEDLGIPVKEEMIARDQLYIAVNVLARHVGARVAVVDMGVASDFEPHPSLIIKKVAKGTANMAQGPAMTRAQAEQAILAGVEVVEAEIKRGLDIVGTGDMGIGNTTPSAAIAAALTGESPAKIAGRGTGVDDEGLKRKVSAVERALAVNQPNSKDGLDILAKVGGFEIGGLAGVILGAAANGKPVMVDGFISTAAAMIAVAVAPAVRPYLISAHRSKEVGHGIMLDWLQLKPLFDLDMRLGEGTGAALGMSMAEAACKVLAEMATFGEAGVSEKE